MAQTLPRNVDVAAQLELLADILELEGEAGFRVVAYRRATIALADEVVFIERGRILARGTHTELLATVPAYADLVRAYEKEDGEWQQ